jgi:hypothetical protein
MRKNLLITLLLLFALYTVSFSQYFTFVRTDPNPKYGPANEQIQCFATVTNSTSNPIPITINIINRSITSGWDSIGMCTWITCYQTGLYYKVESLPVGTHDFDIYFTPNNIPGTGLCTVTMTYLSQTISQDFGAIANPIGIKPISSIVKDFSLSQNYPNPFNPSTKINFSIPKSGFVDMRVYDILGKEVKTLVNENLNAGEYEIEFDASGLTSGLYFYKMQTSEFISVKKMTLIK